MKLKRRTPKKLSEAQAIMSKGEREKTIFIQSQEVGDFHLFAPLMLLVCTYSGLIMSCLPLQEEKDKQMAALKQRFARISNERTIVAKSGRKSMCLSFL